MEKEQSFQQMELGKLVVHKGGKQNFDPYLTSHVKINSKWLIDLNVKPKTLKLLEENMIKSLQPWISQKFLIYNKE